MWLPTRNLNILFIAAISPLFETFLCILKNSIEKFFLDAWKIFPLYCVLGSSHENLTGAQISKEVNFIIFEVLKSVHLVSRKHAIFCSSTIFI